MDINEAIRHAIDGNAVLFAGSGFSFGSVGLGGDSPLSGRGLARKLYADVGVDAEDSDLSIASQLYVERFGEAQLTRLCREMFTIKSSGAHHREIVDLPWQRIYTTNYDDLIERSGIDVGRAITPITPSDSPERYLSTGRVCLHINGFISRLGVGDLSSNFKLTFESYLHDALEGTPWQSVLRQDLRLARAIIFIGYSMYDLDLARIAHGEDIKGKAIFILSPDLKANSPDALRLPFFGSTHKIGAIDFSKMVRHEKTIYSRPEITFEPVALEKISAKLSLTPPTNSDVEKLFLYGDVKNELLGSHSANSATRYYLLDRPATSLATQTIEAGRDVVLTSELGNGKTIALEQISYKLAALGWQVLRLREDSKAVRKELSQIVSSDVPTVLVIDGYIPFLDAIDFVSIRRVGKKIVFLLSSRSHVHDVYLERLENALRVQEVDEFDLNLLEREDARSLVSMIDTYGLWTEFSNLSDSDRMKLVLSDCGGQFHQILLKLYSSPQIAGKVKALFDEIKPHVKQIATAVFIIKATDTPLQKHVVDDLLEGSPLVRMSNTERESVRFLWSDSGGVFKLRSSVLAEFYLTSQSNASEVVAVLSSMFKRAQILGGRTYEYFMRSAMTYSALQKMLPKNGLRAAVVNFYEDIQNTAFAKKNPHYWLQYAIARLAVEDDDFDRIGGYFKAAYAFAKLLPAYDTYQIDNHFARFQLMSACRSQDPGHAFDLYIEAKAILLRQTLREQKHQPYRAAAAVADFARAHGKSLDERQIQDVRRFCEKVIERISGLKPQVGNHRHVVRCRNELSSIRTWLDSPD